MTNYPEINALRKFISDHNVAILPHDVVPPVAMMIPLSVIIGNHQFIVYVHDEYEDLLLNRLSVHTVLILRELELIEESSDYTNWCCLQGIETDHEVLRQYYQDTIMILPTLYHYFDDTTITSFISDLDFQLHAGAMQYLRSISAKDGK